MMKATLGMNYRTLSASLEDQSNRLYDLRQQSATGKKMNRPSDNPAAIRPLLNYRLRVDTTDRYLNHISAAQGEMEVQDSSLDQVENIMASAKEAAIAAKSGAANEQDRAAYADRVDQLFEELFQMANTRNSGKYIYAGYKEATVPFRINPDYDPQAYNPEDASTWAVSYQGDANAKTLEIAPEKRVQTALTGNELFLGDADGNKAVDADGTDLFSVLKNTEAAIRAGDEAAMEESLARLEQGADQVRRLRGRMGNNAWRIDRANQYMSDAAIELKEVISGYEDANILEVFTELTQQETAFKAALNVTSRVSKLSILDYM
ncbi:MAG TPA: flagellar hook-associated protein FlgL [Desulfosalsimonadaceae bacterium]|nr:flagellar hook-associated protein FlgL [Desulfosalsimonadaceae bacterium]